MREREEEGERERKEEERGSELAFEAVFTGSLDPAGVNCRPKEENCD